MTRPSNLRLVLAAILALATVLFIVGSVAESSEAKETGQERVSERADEGAEGTEAHVEAEEEETFLGLDIESTRTRVAAVVISLAAIAAVLAGGRGWLYAVAVLMLLFVVLDVAEAANKAEHSDAGLTALAALIACLHLGVAFGSMLAARDEAASPAAA